MENLSTYIIQTYSQKSNLIFLNKYSYIKLNFTVGTNIDIKQFLLLGYFTKWLSAAL